MFIEGYILDLLPLSLFSLKKNSGTEGVLFIVKMCICVTLKEPKSCYIVGQREYMFALVTVRIHPN